MLFNKNILIAASALAASAFTLSAGAATATANFQVKMTILKACSVTAGATSDVQIGAVAGVLASATNTSGSNDIFVTCSKNTPYFIGLAPSTANGGDDQGAGSMSSVTSSEKVPYQLYSNVGLTTKWGNTATTVAAGNGVGGTGNATGTANSHKVYAVAPSANFIPASYADTVTVTVNY